MTPVCSTNQLTTTTYFYDLATEHLYIKLVNERGTNDYTSQWGLSYYNSNYPDIRIIASCPKCTPVMTATPPQPVLNPAEELYTAELKTAGGTKMGDSFYFFDPIDKTLDFNIIHQFVNKATAIELYTLAGSLLTTKLFPIAISPVRGVLNLSRQQWQMLVAGQLQIAVSIAGQPKYLTGTIVCKGTCSQPTAGITEDPCNPTDMILPIYNDSLVAPWADSSWNGGNNETTIRNLSSTEAALCGSKGIKLNVKSGAFSPAIYQPAQYIRMNPTFKSLEFFVKLAPGYGEAKLAVAFSNSTGTWMNDIVISSKHIDNFIVDEYQWTRVRVGLEDLKIANLATNRLVIHLEYNSQRKEMYIDEIRLSSAAPNTVFVPPCDPGIPTDPNVSSTEPEVESSASLILGSALALLMCLLM